MNKRFLLFGGDEYYAGGGFSDFLDGFDTLADAVRYARGRERAENTRYQIEWWQVFDTGERAIVAFCGAAHRGKSWEGVQEYPRLEV